MNSSVSWFNHRANVTIWAMFLFVLALLGYFSQVMFFTTVYAGIAFSAYFFFVLLRKPLNINSFDFFKIAICGGFFIGPGLVIIKSTPYLRQMGPILVGPFAYTGYSPNLSLAYASMVFTFIILHIVSFKGITDETRKHLESLQQFQRITSTDYVFLIMLTAFIAYAFHVGQLGFQGIQPLAINLAAGQDYVRTTGLGQITGHALPALVPTIMALMFVEKSTIKRIFLAAMLMLNFGFLVTTGRRQIIFAAFVSLAMYFIIDKRAIEFFSTKNMRRSLKVVMGLALGVALVFSASLCFYAMRVAGWQLQTAYGTNVPMAARLSLSVQILENPKGSGFLKRSSDDTSVRPATLIGYIKALESSPRQHYMLGQCFLTNALTDVPTAIWPDKNRYTNSVMPCQDQDVNYMFGLVQLDSPGTAESYGYADFGPLGTILYPIFWSAFVGILLNLCMRPHLLSFKVFAFSVVAFYSVFAEAAMTSYLDPFRTLLFIYPCVLAYDIFVFGIGRRLVKRTFASMPIVPLPHKG